MNKIERYTWEDLLVKAQAAGIIDNGDLLVCLKLSAGINWVPNDGRVPGLYWKNDSAFEVYGIGRSTFYKKNADGSSRNRKLFELGFLTHDNRQNLLPAIPEQSLVETIESLHRERVDIAISKITKDAEKSLVETDSSLQERLEESLGDNPFSEDNLVDILSEDSTVPVVANAPTAGTNKSIYSDLIDYSKVDSVRPLLLELDNLLLKMKGSSLSSSSALFTDDSAPVSTRDYVDDRYKAVYAHDLRHGKIDPDTRYEDYAKCKDRGEPTEKKKYAW